MGKLIHKYIANQHHRKIQFKLRNSKNQHKQSMDHCTLCFNFMFIKWCDANIVYWRLRQCWRSEYPKNSFDVLFDLVGTIFLLWSCRLWNFLDLLDFNLKRVFSSLLIKVFQLLSSSRLAASASRRETLVRTKNDTSSSKTTSTSDLFLITSVFLS